ncbi:MAG: hypothetical protein WCX17_00940 [Parcubacteria group bacterium]|jgi:hypothetical protein
MESPENYQPTLGEVEDAKENMTEKEKKSSEVREQNWEQQQPPWEDFGDNVDEKGYRKPPKPEDEKKMRQRIVELGELFKDADFKWHLDGAINISLMKGEFIGVHKDVDISVEKAELSKLDDHLGQRGYGLFISYLPKGSENKILRRVGAENFEVTTDEALQIAAIDENGKLKQDRELNFIDVHIIKRNEDGVQLSKHGNGVGLPQRWSESQTTEFKSEKINLAHPAEIAYFKLWQERNYDLTDLHKLAESGKLTNEDISEVENIIEKEFIENKKRGKHGMEDVAIEITANMSADEILNIFSKNPIFKSGVENWREVFSEFTEKIAESKDKSAEFMFNLGLKFFNEEGRNNIIRQKIKIVRQWIREAENLQEVRDKLKNNL